MSALVVFSFPGFNVLLFIVSSSVITVIKKGETDPEVLWSSYPGSNLLFAIINRLTDLHYNVVNCSIGEKPTIAHLIKQISQLTTLFEYFGLGPLILIYFAE